MSRRKRRHAVTGTVTPSRYAAGDNSPTWGERQGWGEHGGVSRLVKGQDWAKS